MRLCVCHCALQRGAKMNQWRQAEVGLSPGDFPAGPRVYSGHYHLPHDVPGTNITYVGSPYQVRESGRRC